MPFALYMDDCANASLLAVLLRKAGHTVVLPVDVGLSGKPDDVHLAYSANNALVLVTKDPDDFELLHQADPVHNGIFGIYQDNDVTKDMSEADIVRAIANLEAAVQLGYQIAHNFHSLNDWR